VTQVHWYALAGEDCKKEEEIFMGHQKLLMTGLVDGV
jgi:hypothetical protein